MRSFEWIVFISFLPVLVVPFVSGKWQQRWLLVAALLPVMACLLHLIAEGWRAQMAILYAVAIMVFALRLVARERAVSRGRAVLASVLTALVVVFGGVFPGWLLPVVTLPEPTGPYRVGIVDRELRDESRDRRLMASVWYPAEEGGAPAPLTHNPDEVMNALADQTGLPALLFQHLRYVTLAASESAPVLTDSDPFPILVFSHGLVGMRLQNSSTLQELASWGYVVVAIDHTDAAAVTVFPDGEARYYDSERFGIPSGVEPTKDLTDERMFPVWVADQRFVYDTLETWAVHDPLLANTLDLTRIGSFGHSFGGATALEVCRVDPRCRGSVDLDGGLYGGSETHPAIRPLLLMTSADSSLDTEAVQGWNALVQSATAGAYWLELPHSNHLSFTFSQLLSPLLAPPGFDPREGLAIVDTYLRAFFETHLRGMDTPLLGPAPGNRDVRWLFAEGSPG